MSADWFCKAGGKEVGPFTSQQLKAMVAKGKLKAHYPIRRGSEGPWVPAGRVKGLFPEGAAEDAKAARPAKSGTPSQQAAGAAKAAKSAGSPKVAKALPAAEAAPTPPSADLPVEVSGSGGHGKHPAFNIDQFNVDAQLPLMTSRKSSGVPAMKQAERKKANMILLGVIGGGLLVITIIFTVAILKGAFSKSEPEKAAKTGEAEEGKTGEKKTDDTKKDEAKWIEVGNAARKGNILLTVKTPTRGGPPPGSTAEGEDLLTFAVTAKHTKTKGEGEDVEMKVDGFKKAVSLKDDANATLKFFGEVVADDAKSIKPGEKAVQFQLVFEAPAKKPKFLHLELPWSVFGEQEMAGFNVPSTKIPPAPKPSPKAKKTESVAEDLSAPKPKPKAAKPAKTAEGEAEEPPAAKTPAKKAATQDPGDDAAAAEPAPKRKRPATKFTETSPEKPGDLGLPPDPKIP
jgi:hypothetical protein